VAPRKAARAAAASKDANGPRRVDQAGWLIGAKATPATSRPQPPQADGLAVYDGAIQIGIVVERHSKCFAFDSAGKYVGTFSTRRARSIPTDTIARALLRNSDGGATGVIGVVGDKVVPGDGGRS
jgi:hypothetical protein